MYDQKNIRRRVYDALNVLMAMNIISKEKKEIKWIGLPTNSAQECQNLEVETHSEDRSPSFFYPCYKSSSFFLLFQLQVERQRRLERIKQKQSQLQELILQVGMNLEFVFIRVVFTCSYSVGSAGDCSCIPTPYDILCD